jgi:hypothetical protein
MKNRATECKGMESPPRGEFTSEVVLPDFPF